MTDALRYRWLADKVIAPDYGDNPWRAQGKGKGYWIDRCKGPEWIEGATLDAAIDAAIAREQGGMSPARYREVSDG